MVGKDDVESAITEVNESNIALLANQIQIDTLNGVCSFEDLCETYSIDRKGLMKIIAELKRRGNNISILENTASFSSPGEETKIGTFIKNYGHVTLNSDSTYKIEDNSPNIKVMFASDTRFGSKYSQPSIFNEMCLRAKEMGVKYIVINGDIVEGMYRGKKDILNQTLFRHGYEEQADYVKDILPRIDGIRYLIVTGEHDLSFLNSKAKVDIGKIIADKREDVTYLGQKNAKLIFTNGTNSNEIVIDLRHHVGTIPYTISYRPQQIISSYRNEDKPDILICSHFLACDSFLRRGVREFQTPSVVATTDEMRMQNTPVYNTVGSWVVTLNKDRKQRLESTSQLLMPYYVTIPEDYKTCKPLIISDKVSIPVKKKLPKDDIDKTFVSVKNGETLIDVCTRLGITELDFNGLIEEMQLRDYDISVVHKEDGTEVIRKKNTIRRSRNIKSPMEDLEHVKLIFLSDTHCCSNTEQKSFTDKVIRDGYKNGYRDVIHFGDVADGDYHNRGDHRYSLHTLGASAQADYIADGYFPVAKEDDLNYFFITGSHDWTHMINGGANLGKMIERARSDMHYLGNDRGIYKTGPNGKTTVEVYHPGGGCAASLSYKPQKYIDKMEPGNKPNILGEGHYHQSHFMFYRNVLSFLVPCLVAKTGFAKRQGLENTMGAYYVDLYINKKGEVEYIEFIEKRFEEKETKENDYRGPRLILK